MEEREDVSLSLCHCGGDGEPINNCDKVRLGPSHVPPPRVLQVFRKLSFLRKFLRSCLDRVAGNAMPEDEFSPRWLDFSQPRHQGLATAHFNKRIDFLMTFGRKLGRLVRTRN